MRIQGNNTHFYTSIHSYKNIHLNLQIINKLIITFMKKLEQNQMDNLLGGRVAPSPAGCFLSGFLSVVSIGMAPFATSSMLNYQYSARCWNS